MSYKGMGVATWECVRNCECHPMTIDALWKTRMSIKVRAQPVGGVSGQPASGAGDHRRAVEDQNVHQGTRAALRGDPVQPTSGVANSPPRSAI